MSFLTPLAFLGALLAIPVLLLYMLRLRRREVFVSSNMLWQQILRDREANTPWQRLRRNLLLLLQLIILALLVLALARPAQIVETISAGRTVLLLDASASMNASDMPEGRTRFEAARDEALRLIGDLGATDEMSIIRVGVGAEVLTEYTGDLQALRRAVNNALPGKGSADWETALTLAAAGAVGAERFNILILTDGGIDESLRLPENLPPPVVLTIGRESGNLAITALAARARPGEAPQLFAQVQNTGTETAELSLVLRLDGRLWEGSGRVSIAGQSQRAFVFSIDQPFQTIEAALVLHSDASHDRLSDDNRAWAVAGTPSTRRALLLAPQPNIFLEQGLRALPGLETYRGDASRSDLPRDRFDLYILDGWLPDALPNADLLILNPPADTPLFRVLGESTNVGLPRDVSMGDPLLRYVDFGGVNLRRYRVIEPGPWARTLIAADDGPLLLAGVEGGQQIAVLSFDLRESDLPLQIDFPLLLANLIEWYTPAELVVAGTSLRVGDTLPLFPPPEADTIRVEHPDGRMTTLALNAGSPSFRDADAPGLYRVQAWQDDTLLSEAHVPVNLFSSSESNITPLSADQIRLGGSDVSVAPEVQISLHEFWPWVTLLALLFVMLEWYAYVRRLQVPTVVTTLRRSTALR